MNQPLQVRAQHERVAPALQVEVRRAESLQDRDQRRRPDQECDAGKDQEIDEHRPGSGRRLTGAAELAPGPDQQGDQGEDAQEEGADHLGEAGEGEEEAAQDGPAAAASGRQPAIQQAEQRQGIEGQPLGGHHVVVPEGCVDRPVARKGVERAGGERGERDE